MSTALPPGIVSKQQIEHNAGVAIGVAITQFVKQMLDHHRLTEGFVRRQVATFVAPPGFDRAGDALDRYKVVVLLGDPGSGLHHAAVHLLGAREAVRPREVLREPGAPVDPGALPPDAGLGLLLDMRRDDIVNPALGRSLAELTSQLADRGSLLVVIARRHSWAGATMGAQDFVHYLEPSPTIEILRRLLELDHPEVSTDTYLSDQRVLSALASAPPDEVSQWVTDILDIEAGRVGTASTDTLITPDELVEKRIERLLEMRSRWRKALLEQHKKFDSRRRNFLLAVAALEGGDAATIFRATSDLAVALGEDPPAAAGQEGPGLIELVDCVGAELHNDDRVTFSRPRYDEAVLEYFWLDRQHLRDRFLDWVANLPTRQPEDAGAVRVAERVAPLILRRIFATRNVTRLKEVVSTWARMRSLHRPAAQLLLAASLHDEIGSSVRQALLSWARQNDTDLKIIVAHVCGGDLVDVRPTDAIYRLAVLGETQDAAVTELVSAAVRRLWLSEHHAQMQRFVIYHSGADRTEASRRAGAALMALLGRQLVDGPVPTLTGDHDKMLTTGWTALLDVLPAAAEAALSPWFDAAEQSNEWRVRLGILLAAAVRGHGVGAGTRAAHLSTALYAWQPVEDDAPQRQAVRDSLYGEVLEKVPLFDASSWPRTDSASQPSPLTTIPPD